MLDVVLAVTFNVADSPLLILKVVPLPLMFKVTTVTLYSIVMELDTKDAAEEVFESFTGRYTKTEKSLKKAAKQADIEYAVDGSDTEYSLIAINNDEEEVMSAYTKLDGKVIVMVAYEGSDDSDLLDEYYEYMSVAGYTDMEALLEEA